MNELLQMFYDETALNTVRNRKFVIVFSRLCTRTTFTLDRAFTWPYLDKIQFWVTENNFVHFLIFTSSTASLVLGSHLS